MDSRCSIQVFTQIFVYSLVKCMLLLLYKLAESNTIDLQVEALCLTSNGIPNKPEKYGLLLEENQGAN